MSISYNTYWNIIKTKDFSPDTYYINVSGEIISKKIKKNIPNCIEMNFLEPEDENDIQTSKKHLRDILRVVHHHYKNGRNIVVFCYHGINRSPGVKYYYHKRYLNDIIEYCPSNELMYNL